MLKHVVLIGAGRETAPRLNRHKIALGLTPHNEIWEALKAQADALVLALFGKRDLTALEHVKDGLRKIEELVRQGQRLSHHGVLGAVCHVNQSSRGNGGAELRSLVFLKAQLVVRIGLALIERTPKAGMTADKERHVLGSLVGHLIGDANGIPLKRIAGDKLKRIRIIAQQRGVILRSQAHRQLVLALAQQLPLLFARKPMASELYMMPGKRHGVVIAQASANREANRCLAGPHGGIALPQILATSGLDRGKRTTSRGHLNRNRIVGESVFHCPSFRTTAFCSQVPVSALTKGQTRTFIDASGIPAM